MSDDDTTSEPEVLAGKYRRPVERHAIGDGRFAVPSSRNPRVQRVIGSIPSWPGPSADQELRLIDADGEGITVERADGVTASIEFTEAGGDTSAAHVRTVRPRPQADVSFGPGFIEGPA